MLRSLSLRLWTMSKVEKALISLLIEEFMDDSLEVDNLVLQTSTKVPLTNLSVLACFDDGSRTQEKEDEELRSPEPPKRKRKRGRKSGPYGPRKKKQSPLTFEALAECVLLQPYGDMDFKVHFKMGRSTFENLCVLLAPGLIARSISVEKKVMVSIWTLSSRESYSLISERFEISKGFLHSVLCSVCGGLSSVQQKYIVMPEASETDDIASGFQQRYHFPGVIGALGCTHIPIREPTRDTELYINKEGSFSMQLQAVCDDKLKFLNVYTGCPGKMQSLTVFKKSPLQQILEENNLPHDQHLVGDCSYPLRQYLMVPFIEDRPLTSIEEIYNRSLAKTRSTIEIAIQLLKHKFTRLHFLDIKQLDDIPIILTAACVLYNFLLLDEESDHINEENLIVEGNDYDVDIIPEPCSKDEMFPDEALIKRISIANKIQNDTD